ncbi:unnamed protein product, partial [marine sediment metagenome]
MINRGGLVVGVLMPYLEPYYTATQNLDIVKNMRGSKYLQAELSSVILNCMRNFKGQILFVGLPCTIRMMKRTFRNKSNILYVELKCHGVIKKDAFNKYQKKYLKDASTISFRDKGRGWRKSVVSYKTTKDSLKHRANSKLIRDFLNNTNLKGQCIHCKQQGYGDIILADYWNCPSHLENKKGTSQVITVTTNGQRFFNSLCNIERKENSLNKVAIMGGASVNNNGSMILTQNFMDYLSKEIKDIDFTIVGYKGSPWEARNSYPYFLNSFC